MTKELVFGPGERVPFALSLAEKVDLSLYSDAANLMREQSALYDPYSQTSGAPVLAGSERTYYDTSTGAIFKDDEGKDT